MFRSSWWGGWGLLFILNAGVFAKEPVSAEMSARIDRHLAEAWRSAGIQPSAVTSDAEFLRRVTLDLTGLLPTVGDIRRFQADSRPDKREHWIAAILARPAHASHLANAWRRVLVPESANVQRILGDTSLHSWLRARFADNLPYDHLVREILGYQASQNQPGPSAYYTALELKPEALAGSSARVFLGLQIQCAECHNHPFDRWTKHDFWGYAAFFTNLQQLVQPAGQRLNLPAGNAAELKFPGTDEIVKPRFLGGDLSTDDNRTRRNRLADWVTARDNPYFAKAAVNRVWALLFGRGIVEPVDDFGAHNPPSHPQLLDDLANYFIESGYDLRSLIATLANTKAYQLSSEVSPASSSEGSAVERPELFARMAIKNLTADQLYDCLAEALRRRDPAANPTANTNRVFDPQRQMFLARFQATGTHATDFQAGIPQALTLMNGRLIANGIDLANSDLLGALAAPFFTDEERVEVLFLSTLSRLPHDDERTQFVRHLASPASEPQRRKALGDMLWALLNSAEFILNH